jgi:hypothetical protein
LIGKLEYFSKKNKKHCFLSWQINDMFLPQKKIFYNTFFCTLVHELRPLISK